jgi:hypothetical protein
MDIDELSLLLEQRANLKYLLTIEGISEGARNTYSEMLRTVESRIAAVSEEDTRNYLLGVPSKIGRNVN